MRIKKFEELNEKSNAAKAISAGYRVGDVVYNTIMKKYLTIAPLDLPTQEYGDEYCSLGAVGSNLDSYYKKNKKDEFRTEYSSSQKAKEGYEANIKQNIDRLLRNEFYTKSELIKLINKYIENKD